MQNALHLKSGKRLERLKYQQNHHGKRIDIGMVAAFNSVMRDAETSEDFDFRHNLRDTILLLGGEPEIADLLTKSQDGFISKADIAKLRKYNVSLFSNVKSRLRELNRLKLTIVP
jgi:hypothetical protein